MDSKTLAFKIAELALTKKAEDIKILDLRKITTIADFFVICTAFSEPQVKAVADAIHIGTKEDGETAWHKEGTSMRSWVLLDYIDVVVHIFLKDTRGFYSLEKLWGDAEITEVSDEAPHGKLAKKTRKESTDKKPAVKKKSASKKKPAVKPKTAAGKRKAARKKK